MTITRRPPRPAATKTAKPAAKKSAESFIEDAHHKPEATPAPTPAPAAAPEPEASEKKGKKHKKDKEKGKNKEHKKRKDKEAVLIRFEDDQLTMMDARAAALGLSRAAWLRMVVAKALMGKKN